MKRENGTSVSFPARLKPATRCYPNGYWLSSRCRAVRAVSQHQQFVLH